jgi:hypothetical protein
MPIEAIFAGVGVRWGWCSAGRDDAARPAKAVAEQAHPADGAQGAPRLIRGVRRLESSGGRP